MSHVSLRSVADGWPSGPATKVILDLENKPAGKCLCHIAATTGLLLRQVNQITPELLALGWIALRLPNDANKEALASLREFSERVTTLRVEEAASEWRAYLDKFEWSEAPLHHVTVLTDVGRQKLRDLSLSV